MTDSKRAHELGKEYGRELKRYEPLYRDQAKVRLHMASWQAKARVKGKVVVKKFKAVSLAEAKRRAREFFPRHKLNNISLSLRG